MATKAENFRYEMERSGPKRPKRQVPPRRDDPVDTSLPGVSATERRAGYPRRPSQAPALHAAYAFEPAEARPSRRSTRRSNAGLRTDAMMQAKRRVALLRPGGRAPQPRR